MMSEAIKDLILKARDGDSQSFYKLVEIHDKKMMVLANQLMNNLYDAEDLYQETFVKAFKHIHTFRFESSFYTWLYKIMVNTSISLKQKLHKIQTLEPVQDFDPLEHTAASPAVKQDEEINQAIREAADSLPEQQRIVFILKHLQQMKIKDISAILNIGEGTVKKYLFRAMEKMRQQMKDYQYV